MAIPDSQRYPFKPLTDYQDHPALEYCSADCRKTQHSYLTRKCPKQFYKNWIKILIFATSRLLVDYRLQIKVQQPQAFLI